MFAGNGDKIVSGAARMSEWNELTEFQLEIARRWLRRGKEIKDTFASFFFYFTGFNAIYYLWAKIDGLKGNDERKRIENVLKKIDEKEAQEILCENKESVDYFSRRPIQRMGYRNKQSQRVGNDEEGKELRKTLQESAEASNRLVALAKIFYLVRCNLFHGSKAESGDDKVVVEKCLAPLRDILQKVIEMTEKKKGLFQPGG